MTAPFYLRGGIANWGGIFSHLFLDNYTSFYVNSLLMPFIHVHFSYLLVIVPYRVNYFHCCVYLSTLFGFRHVKVSYSHVVKLVFPFVISFITSPKFFCVCLFLFNFSDDKVTHMLIIKMQENIKLKMQPPINFSSTKTTLLMSWCISFLFKKKI